MKDEWAVKKYGYRSFDELVGRHNRRPIFVLGSGPSMKYIDLSCLNGQITIGVNKIWDIYPNLMYWMSKDTVQQRGMIPKDTKTVKIIDGGRLARMYRFGEMPRIKGEGYLARYVGGLVESRKYNDGLAGNVTTILPAIHAAAIMGGDPVVLLGVDLCFRRKDGSTHCYSGRSIPPADNTIVLTVDRNGDPDLLTTKLYHTMLLEFQMNAEPIKKAGIEVLDATTGGILDCFKKIRLEDVL